MVDYEVRIDRVLAASPERVWHALTDPEALAGWFWPESFGTKANVDLRPRGAFRIEGGGMAVQGEYVSVEPLSRLVFTWSWDGEDDESLVTIELSSMDTGTGTALALTHSRFADESTRDSHHTGWSDCLNRLPGWLAAGHDVAQR